VRFSPWLRTQRIRAAEAPEALLEELWRLRLSVIDLRPEVTREADYAAFRSFFDGDVEILVHRTADGHAQGFYGWRADRIETPVGPRILVEMEYGFIKPAFRSHAALLMGLAGLVLRVTARHRSSKCVFIGAGYATGLLSLARIAHRIVCLKDAEIERWERELLCHFLDSHFADTFDRERGLVRMRTLPKEVRREPRTPEGRAWLAWYESHNPHWTEGWGLPVLIHIDLRAFVAGVVRQTVQRPGGAGG
jgi:hypothetical protein